MHYLKTALLAIFIGLIIGSINAVQAATFAQLSSKVDQLNGIITMEQIDNINNMTISGSSIITQSAGTYH